MVFLVDCQGNANILHYSSVKSKRVLRSVLAAEMFAAVHTFDFASTLWVTINYLFGRSIRLELYADSKSCFDCIV